MNSRVCMCCGEIIGENGDDHSRHVNLCASCSSLADGMPGSSLSELSQIEDDSLVRIHFRKITADSEAWAA